MDRRRRRGCDAPRAAPDLSGSGPGIAMNPFRRTLFLHQDGVMLTATLSSLRERKVMDHLLGARSLTVRDLARHSRANAAYLHVVLRCLASQGWLTRHGRPGTEDLRYALTEWGARASAVFPLYEQAGDFLRAHFPFDWLLSGPGPPAAIGAFADLVDQAVDGWSLALRLPEAPAALVDHVRHHLDGALVAPVMLAREALDDPQRLTARAPASAAHPHALRLLGALGWYDTDRQEWTALGKVARDYALHYGLVGSYFPMLAALPRLLFAGRPSLARVSPGEPECHVDRRLNVQASAVAHRRYFQDADAIFLELFDREPVGTQPDFVADIGCGDGTWLTRIYELARTRTRRGGALSRHPLTMVGVDYSATALEVARRTFEAAGLRHVVLLGDITHPERLAEDLRRHGLDIARGLHIRSFIDHNRRYQPRPDGPRSAGAPEPSGAYVSDDGAAVPNDLLQQDLVGFLERWAPYARAYGLVILEAHCVEPRVASRHLGDTHSVSFDAYHGLSHQYPVDFARFMQAARTAGLEPVLSQHRRYPTRRPFVAISLNRFRAVTDDAVVPAGPPPPRGAHEWQPAPDGDLQDGEALHRLLYEGGDLRRPRGWCGYPTGVLVGMALDGLARRVDEIENGRRPRRVAVMDYGSGTGLLAIELLKGCRERGLLARMERLGVTFELWLLDIPSGWFAKGHALLRECRYTRFVALTDRTGGFRPLDHVMAAASVDLAMASMVLHLVPPRALPTVFEGIARVVKPDGRFIWNAPDLGPPLPASVPFHEPNRRLRRRALQMLGDPAGLGPLLAALPAPERREFEGLTAAVAGAVGRLSPEDRRRAEREADRQILPHPTSTALVERGLRTFFEGGVSMKAFEMTAQDALDAILVPANQRYLAELGDRAVRETLLRLLMTHDVLPALLGGPAATATGFNVCWTFGDFVPRAPLR